MHLYRRGRIWWIGYSEDGARKAKSLHRYLGLSFPVTNRHTAQNLFAKMRLAEINDALGIPGEIPSIGLDELYRGFLIYYEQNRTPKSLRSVKERLGRFIDFAKAQGLSRTAEITQNTLASFIESELRGSANATLNRYTTAVRTALRWAVERGHIESNPLEKAPRFKEARRAKIFTFGEDDIKKLFSVEDKLLADYFRTVYYTAARRSEALNLTRDDIDFGRKLVIFRQTKAGQLQTVPMAKKLIPTLRRLTAQAQNGFLFPSLSDNKITKAFQRLQRRLKLKSIRSIHDLRAAFLTKLMESGVDLDTVHKLARHKSRWTTWQYYIHVPDQKKKEAIDRA